MRVLALLVGCQGLADPPPVNDTQILWTRGTHHVVADTTLHATFPDYVIDYTLTLDGETLVAGSVQKQSYAPRVTLSGAAICVTATSHVDEVPRCRAIQLGDWIRPR